MRRTIIGAAAAMCIASAGNADNVDRRDTERFATDLSRALSQVSYEARGYGEHASRAGNQIRARRMYDLSTESGMLQRKFDRHVLSVLRDRRTPDHVAARSLDMLRNDFMSLFRAAEVIQVMPRELEYLLTDIKQNYRELQRMLGHTGGGRPGPRPGPGPWPGPGPRPGPHPRLISAQCEVVLEGVFGRDIQRFYGVGQGPNFAFAATNAQQHAMAQCQSRNSNITKCTLVQGSCQEVFGHGGRI